MEIGKHLFAALLFTGGALCGARDSTAAETEIQIAPRAGFGELRVEPFGGLNTERIEVDTQGLGVSLGVLTPIGLVAEVGADEFGDYDFFDSFDGYELSQQFVSVGYQFELGSGWRLVPRVGRMKWKLRSEEGRLFNPGPEETTEVRGYDYYWEVGVSRRISKVVSLGMNYKQGSFDFGRSHSVAFLVTLGF
jgi:hypothetical protein